MRNRIRILILFRFKTRQKYTFYMKNIFIKLVRGKNIPAKIHRPFGKAGNGFIVNFCTLLDPDPHSYTDPDPGLPNECGSGSTTTIQSMDMSGKNFCDIALSGTIRIYRRILSNAGTYPTCEEFDS
jgi:hypothetical protein